MAAASGWYPDPGGQAGMFRYWDGRSWSAALSPHPAPAPPPSAVGLPPSPTPAVRPVPFQPAGLPPRRRRAWGWAVALAAILVALVVIAVLVLQRVLPDGGGAGVPAGQPSSDVCPKPDNGTPEPQPNDGRVHAGKLSYPRLGPPWSAPAPESGVAFGKGVLIQSVEIEHAGTQSWLAAVLLGELVAGDGFFTPKDGAAIVVRCVSGTFYGDSAVTREDKRNQALEVDGHDGWVIESQLHFNVPGIQAKSERLIVVVVDTGTGSAGLFYASIPENAEYLVSPARAALAAVTVDG
jgi:hypothetical protein